MSVFSNMESVALFVNDVKDPNVTNHPHREIPLPLWMFLLFGRKCFQLWSHVCDDIEETSGKVYIQKASICQ